MSRGSNRWLAGLLLAVVMALGTRQAVAQTDPRLVAAVRDAQEGRGDSARVAVDRLLAATPPADTLYPQILYTQAMVAGSAGDMRRLLQRVAVEYSTSSWTDDALLRLVQMDYATRNYEGAARNLERLRVDFPSTPLMPQAAYWAGRTYFDANNPSAACRWLADGMAQARSDVELQNQLSYLYQRCDMGSDSTGPRVAADSARRDTVAQASGAPGAPTTAAPPTSAAADSTRPAPSASPRARPHRLSRADRGRRQPEGRRGRCPEGPAAGADRRHRARRRTLQGARRRISDPRGGPDCRDQPQEQAGR